MRKRAITVNDGKGYRYARDCEPGHLTCRARQREALLRWPHDGRKIRWGVYRPPLRCNQIGERAFCDRVGTQDSARDPPCGGAWRKSCHERQHIGRGPELSSLVAKSASANEPLAFSSRAPVREG
jgi:hypothetical protein